MANKNTKILLTLMIVAILIWLLKDTFSQRTTGDLKGGFTERASYRNDNNTGPIQRIFSVSVTDTADAELEAYGNLMPHSKYGNTKVYFFKEGDAAPTQLFPGRLNFDATYAKNCYALYEKSAMGNFVVILNPFTQKQKNQ